MKIEHLALWVTDLERTREFYCTYFDAKSNSRYQNPKTGFSSYFLTFQGEARLEIMSREDVEKPTSTNSLGYAHLAISVGDKEAVVAKTEELRTAGYEVYSEPRTTGDGYFESVVKDPEGNLIEITI